MCEEDSEVLHVEEECESWNVLKLLRSLSRSIVQQLMRPAQTSIQENKKTTKEKHKQKETKQNKKYENLRM
jgi:hypothetical protein